MVSAVSSHNYPTQKEMKLRMQQVKVLRKHGFTWTAIARILGLKSHTYIFRKAKELGIA